MIRNSIGMPIVKLPHGGFRMGSPTGEKFAPWNDIFAFMDPAGHFVPNTAGDDEKPQRKVRITRRFGIGMYPVTVGQFQRFIEETGYQTTAETNAVGAIGISLDTGNVHLDPHFTWRVNSPYPQPRSSTRSFPVTYCWKNSRTSTSHTRSR